MVAMLDFLSTSAQTIFEALKALTLPFLFFLALGYLIRRNRFFESLRRIYPESLLNLQIMIFNLIFITPLLVSMTTQLQIGVSTLQISLIKPEVWAAFHPALVVLIAVFIGDFVGYWRHRFEHTPIL